MSWRAPYPLHKRKQFVLAVTVAIFSADAALAQSNDDDISKEVENPVTRQITLPLRYQADFEDGAYRATKESFILNYAIVPFALNDDWAVITRTKMPWTALPPKKFGQSWDSGFTNGNTTFFLSPRQGSGIFWGAGPVLYYPSAESADLGVHRWGTGPSVAFIKKDDGPWVFGAIVNNIWTPGASSQKSNGTNQMLLNPFASYHFDNGWAVGSSPSIMANWISSSGNWTVPIGGDISKTVRISDQPIKFDVAAFYNAIRPKPDNDTWQLQFTITFTF
jgi:hypothetical protein